METIAKDRFSAESVDVCPILQLESVSSSNLHLSNEKLSIKFSIPMPFVKYRIFAQVYLGIPERKRGN